MAFLPPEFAETKTGSIGKAIPNGKLYLVDTRREKILSAEIEGELVYEGPNVTLGYALTPDDLSKGDERNGILYTGDIARMDEDGFFYIVGRVNRFLKLYGLRISLDEMEQLISSNFETETMCSGSDQKLNVFITKKDLLFEVSEFISKKTALHHQAFQVIWIDKIPRNESGKIIYNADPNHK
jgi:acyl-coenzyme A synthetase/AMP-(fatty) acid ligase